MIKPRLLLPVLAACAALLVPVAGCGGSSGDESSSAAPATIAPPGSGVFVEGTLRPEGSLKTNVEGLFENVTGLDTSLGELITTEIEKAAASSGDDFSYKEDVEPWLGEKAGIAFGEYDGDNFSNLAFILQSTDTGKTQELIDKVSEESDEEIKDESFEGVDFKLNTEDDSAIGVVDGFAVFAQSEEAFKEVVEASEGESLADVDNYSSIASKAPDGALADVYVDIAGLIEQAGNEVEPQVEELLEASGIELDEAVALLSVVPGSESLELDVASNAGKELAAPPAESLLESLPADSFAAVASSEYGKRLQENLDSLDETGIPGSIPPHKLKSALKQEGIDLDKLTEQLQDAAAFATGSDRGSLGGAAVLTTKDPAQATNTVSNIGLLLRANHTPGVTAVSGRASGFSVRSPELGRKPLVVAAKGERIAIGYGLPQALEALEAVSVKPLSGNPAFEEAKQALGGTPIGGFVDGPAALKLARALVPRLDSGFEAARPYLSKVAYIGFGGESEGDLATLKVVAGLAK